MMTKTWNFVAKKIADGANKLLSFFCLILIWCVCMIFSKISLVTSHGAFSTRLHFTAGNTPWYVHVSLEWYFIYLLFLASVHGFTYETNDFFYSVITFSYIKCFVHSYTVDVVFTLSYVKKINQSTTNIHSVPSVLVFRTAQIENTRLKCSGDVSLGNECKNKLQTHTQESSYDTYFKHGIGWDTAQYGKGYCQRYDDFQGNNGHFIGDWLNIAYRYFSNTPRKLSRFPIERSLYSSAVLCFILFKTLFPQPFSPIRSLAMAYHVIDQWIV